MDTSDPRQLWHAAKGELQLQLTPDIFEMYIHGAKPISLDGDTLTIGCPNEYMVEWLSKRLDRVVRRTLSSIAGHPMSTRYMLTPAGQMPLLQETPEAGGTVALVRPGEIRQAGYVQLWHDLRLLYGPKIGLQGVGLWAEIRAAINENDRHPLHGYAWLSLRKIEEHYTEGRTAITSTIESLRTADLLSWHTGREMVEIWEAQAAAGVPDRSNPGIPLSTLSRFFSNPTASRVYTVNDPLEVPEFCARFDLVITLDKTTNRAVFQDYPGRLTARWQDWLKGLMAVNQLTTISPDDWRKFGLL